MEQLAGGRLRQELRLQCFGTILSPWETSVFIPNVLNRLAEAQPHMETNLLSFKSTGGGCLSYPKILPKTF